MHDPLVEWTHTGAHPELGNPQAQDALRTLQARFCGQSSARSPGANMAHVPSCHVHHPQSRLHLPSFCPVLYSLLWVASPSWITRCVCPA